MTVVTSPKPPQPEEPEALIEEARRRARRRRLACLASTVLVLAIGGGVYAIVALTGGGASSTTAPQGFHLVQAQGPVEHVRAAQYSRLRPTVIDLASGRARRVPFDLEEWWDKKSGLDRAVFRIAGRIQADTVGQSCQPKPRFCFPLPLPFDLAGYGLRWPVDEKRFRALEKGTFHGRDVVWVRSLVNNPAVNTGDRLAFAARTHELVGKRWDTPMPTEEVYTELPDLPAGGFSFVVPEGGGALHSFPPSPQPDTESSPSSLRAAQSAIRAVPLWLGPRFHGAGLSVAVGTEGMKTRTGATLRKARFVTFDYGTFKLQEFGSDHPFWYEQGPLPGRIVIDGGTRAAVTRNGVLVLVESDGRLFTAARALEIVKALLPLR